MRQLPILLFLLLCIGACPPTKKTNTPKSPQGVLDSIPDSTAAVFTGISAQEFWGGDTFWRVKSLTVFQASFRGVAIQSLSKAASEEGGLQKTGLYPEREMGIALDAELLADGYLMLSGTGQGDRVIFSDHARTQSLVTYFVLPVQDGKVFKDWLKKAASSSTRKIAVAESTIGERKALIFSDGVVVVFDGELAYLFALQLSSPDEVLEKEHPVKTIDLFRQSVEAFFQRRSTTFGSNQSLQAALQKAEKPFFFADLKKLVSLSEKTKPSDWFRVYYQDGETPARVEKNPSNMTSQGAKYDARRSTMMSVAAVLPWVFFTASTQDKVVSLEGTAPITALYQREIELSLQPMSAQLDLSHLFSGDVSYFAQFSLRPEAFSNATALSFLTSWVSSDDLVTSNSTWKSKVKLLQDVGFDASAYFVEKTTGNFAIALVGKSKEGERFLSAKSNIGGRGADSFSVRSIGALSSVLDLFALSSDESLLEFVSRPGGVLVVQMKSPEAVDELLVALDKVAAKDSKAVIIEGQIRKIPIMSGRVWHLVKSDDLLLVGGDPKELEALLAQKKAGATVNEKLKAQFPFEGNRVGALLDMDVLLSQLAQKEIERKNPSEAAYYQQQMGRGPLWFSLRYEGGLFRYSAKLP